MLPVERVGGEASTGLTRSLNRRLREMAIAA